MVSVPPLVPASTLPRQVAGHQTGGTTAAEEPPNSQPIGMGFGVGPVRQAWVCTVVYSSALEDGGAGPDLYFAWVPRPPCVRPCSDRATA